MRGTPQSGFSAALRRIRAWTSREIVGRPGLSRDFHRQNSRKPSRCHRTTVAGWTRTSQRGQFMNQRESMIQKARSEAWKRGRVEVRWQAVSCCRNERFSRARVVRGMSARRRDRRATPGSKGAAMKRRPMERMRASMAWLEAAGGVLVGIGSRSPGCEIAKSEAGILRRNDLATFPVGSNGQFLGVVATCGIRC